MGFESGGLADKLGNRYEGRWVAKQLLRLLNEEIRCVTIEAIGDDEKGVDLWVGRNDGSRQAQQCKARNRSEDSWSVNGIKSRSVFTYAKFQLDANENNTFGLVSAIGAQTFLDLCESARNSNRDSENFYKHQIDAIGHHRRNGFRQFCEAFQLNPDDPSDRKRAFNYLCRIFFILYPDDQNNWQNLLAEAGYLLTGAPEATISTLIAYAENNYAFRRPIYADELRNHLATLGIHPKHLAHDTRIAPAVEELQRQFEESIRPGLIGNRIVPREETAQLLQLIHEGKDVILHGTAGNGKSAVLYELITQHLRAGNIPFLPVRLDRRDPQKTAGQFGCDMGLPDSPVYSLIAVAGDRPCVILLDQLDAIRWTSAHSANALDVCKELLRQVRQLRYSGRKIMAVLSCRTFDLENDPEIRNWLSQDKTFGKVEVTYLTSKVLEDIVGSSIKQMTNRQQQILACPQNLAMWLTLKDGNFIPVFCSVTELMRCFWQNRRELLESAGIPQTDINNTLDSFLEETERTGKLSVSARPFSSRYPRVLQALQSYGIIQEGNGKLTFCHQSYLDYLIADRLLQQINKKEGDVIDWLGPKDRQSLFRREQLRQILTMMTEEMPIEFVQTVKKLLESDKVRFHIKHVVLELIGQLTGPNEDLGDYLLSLIDSSYWKKHIIETIFLGHAVFIDILIEKGLISAWLNSEIKEDIDLALWLLRSVAETIPDRVAEILASFVDKGASWHSRILTALCWNAANDSDKMFQLRLRLVSLGVFAGYTNWQDLCKKSPLHALQLIEAFASTWSVEPSDTSSSTSTSTAPMDRADKLYKDDIKALKDVAERHAKTAWDLLVPHIVRLTDFLPAPQYDRRLDKWQRDMWTRSDGYTDLSRGIVDLAITAGRKLAADEPEELMMRTMDLARHSSIAIQEIMIDTYSNLARPYADVGIRWLLEDQSRLQLGTGYDEPAWMPAVRLVKSLSPYCSEEIFRSLETTIIHYHPADEKRLAKYWLNAWRDGYFDHYWGRPQYFLLPALDSQRILPQTVDLMAVIKRKFEKYDEERFLRNRRPRGGRVGSKLDKTLDRISDRAWLVIIGNADIPIKDGKWKQIDEDRLLTSDVERFSDSLGRIAKRFPERFGQFALRLSHDTHPYYIAAIFDALALKNPHADMSGEEKAGWSPATVGTVEAVIERFKSDDDLGTATSFCRLIRSRAEESWSDAVIARLIRYAQGHPDLESGKLNVHCDKTADEATVQMLFANTINCVRGVAAEAIGALLWDHGDWLDRLRPGIDALVKDSHPVVRMAAIEALLPVVNIDRDLAVDWFCQTCGDDLRVAASPRAVRFFNSTFGSHAEKLLPLVRAMANSDLDEVSQEGAKEVAARWLFHGLFSEEIEGCRNGNIAQRKGVAQVASHYLRDAAYSARCRELLAALINDPEKDVRTEAAKMARHPAFLQGAVNQDFINTYINSQAYIDHPSDIVYNLKDFAGSLLPVSEIIFAVCRVFSTTLLEKSRDLGLAVPHSVSDIYTVLLRLYEQSEGLGNSTTRNQCLDTWDMMFENRVGIIQELTKAIEK